MSMKSRGVLRLNAPGDQYLTRLVKLIPAEVVALYLTFKEVASSWLPIWGWICLGLVLAVRLHATSTPAKPVQRFSVLVAFVSFILWIYATGDHLIKLDLPPGVLSVAVGVWTFIVPMFYKGD